MIFKITRDGESGSYEHVFAIGGASLEGSLDGTEGNGTLTGGQKGSATWLMIPLSEAAPGIDDAQYFVSFTDQRMRKERSGVPAAYITYGA